MNSPAIFLKAKFYLALVLTILCVCESVCIHMTSEYVVFVFVCVHTHDFSVLFVCLGVFAWLQSVQCVLVCVHLCVYVCMTSKCAVYVCVYTKLKNGMCVSLYVYA